MEDSNMQINGSTQHCYCRSHCEGQQKVSPHKTSAMQVKRRVSLVVILLAGIAFLFLTIDNGGAQETSAAHVTAKKVKTFDDQIVVTADNMIEEGRQTFRFDTFGDEAFWGDILELHQAIKGAALGGVGPGLSPRAALTLGLKVDLEALPRSLVKDLGKREGEP